MLTLLRTDADGNASKLFFTTSLQYQYRRDSVKLYANVALATHGETVNETLGSGAARQAHQHFTLKHIPLTYVGAANETGAEAALEVRVNAIRWHETPTLYNAGANDRSYVLRMGKDSAGTIQFGDGRHGARLPTGQENLRAIYRKGIGATGNLKAGQLAQLLTRPLGLKDDYYGQDKSLWLELDSNPPKVIPRNTIRICDLSDIKDGGGTVIAWAHQPTAGSGLVSIDPVLGRIAFADVPASAPLVSFHYGFTHFIGGGEYERGDPAVPDQTVKGGAALQPTLNIVQNGGTVEVLDSRRYVETPAITVNAGKTVVLRAANGARPLLAASGDIQLTLGASSAPKPR